MSLTCNDDHELDATEGFSDGEAQGDTLATRFDYWHELVYSPYIMSNCIEAIVSILLMAIKS